MLWLVQAIARLHNLCINERLEEELTAFEVPDDLVPSYIPTLPHNEDGDPVALDAAFDGVIEGDSFLREYMATRVQKKQLQRPSNNTNRKKRSIEEVEV